MSISEKVLQLKQDFDEVHNKGYEDGKNSVVQFDRYLQNGSTLVGLGIFNNNEIELNLDNMTGLHSFLYEQKEQYKNTAVEHLIINCPNTVTNIQQAVRCTGACTDTVLKKVTFNFSTQSITNCFQTFGNRQALETIDGVPLDFSSNTTNNIQPFVNCYSLKNFKVVKNSINKTFLVAHSNLLSTDTIQSIIDGLATVSTAQTLTLHNNLKILQSQVDSANAKGWTVAGGTVVSEEEYYA